MQLIFIIDYCFFLQYINVFYGCDIMNPIVWGIFAALVIISLFDWS